MFWGLIMEPNKRYTQTVEKAFHLSMASLDASTAVSGNLVQVMLCYDSRNYLLCTMQKDSILQVPLDLNFQEGTKIAFTCNGHGHVHLTGYLIPEDEGLDELDDFEEDEEEEDDEEIPKLVGQKKRKALNSPKDNTDLKRVKKLKAENEEDEDDDDESDSENEDGGLGLDDDSDDELEADEDEDDSDDGDEEEVSESPVKTSKKQKQKQNKQNKQIQNQQKNKKEKNKVVNGKDIKSENEQGKQKKNKDDTKSDESSELQQKRRTVEGGVQIEDLKVGNGAPAKAGKFVSVYYIGRLKNGKKFDATQQGGEGFKFRLGRGEVIKGWDVGIIGMKVGGKRRISIPPNMGYGAKGSPPVIPPNSVLNFEVELKAIH